MAATKVRQMDFLVLYKTGEGIADYDVAGMILGKTNEEAVEAIREAMTRGEGEYVAVPFDAGRIVRRVAKRRMDLEAPSSAP